MALPLNGRPPLRCQDPETVLVPFIVMTVMPPSGPSPDCRQNNAVRTSGQGTHAGSLFWYPSLHPADRGSSCPGTENILNQWSGIHASRMNDSNPDCPAANGNRVVAGRDPLERKNPCFSGPVLPNSGYPKITPCRKRIIMGLYVLIQKKRSACRDQGCSLV